MDGKYPWLCQKEERNPPWHLTWEIARGFYTQGQRANQVSSFDTNMELQKKLLLLMSFFRAVERRINVDMVDFTLKWKQQGTFKAKFWSEFH